MRSDNPSPPRGDGNALPYPTGSRRRFRAQQQLERPAHGNSGLPPNEDALTRSAGARFTVAAESISACTPGRIRVGADR